MDEGSGPVVLLLHGNPTWSFLYRNVIRRLGPGMRALAPDYPGFGRSPAPAGYGFTPEEHAEGIRRLLEQLGVEEFVLVAHDWGGPIGLSLAVEDPGRVRGMVVSNSWCWPPGPALRAFSWMMGGPLGRWLQLRYNVFARRLVPAGIHRRGGTSRDVLDAYSQPFEERERRIAPWALARAIRTSAPWIGRTEARLQTLERTPAELVWGMRDPVLGRNRHLERWAETLPRARIDRVEDAGHFVPEDRPDRVAAAVRRIADRREPGS